MTYEDSLTECAWCGSEHIQTIVGYEPHQLALCQDCNDRYRHREHENESPSWNFAEINNVHFSGIELADALRQDRVYELVWSKLYKQYALTLDGDEFITLVKQKRKAILNYLAGTLETGMGLTIPVGVPSQEKANVESNVSPSTCNQQSG